MEPLTARFRAAFLADPSSAFRDWFREQERLREEGCDEDARELAEDLWRLAPGLRFASEGERARFLHNFAVFLGSPGPAASLERALALFETPLAVWTVDEEPDDHARALHNRANALQNLGTAALELTEAVDLYERALLVRTAEARAIARSVTLHNMGAALRRLAELAPASALASLTRSERVLMEAIALRDAQELREGGALSRFQLGLTLRALAALGRPGAADAAARAFAEAAERYEALGKAGEAGVARRLAAGEG